MRWAKDGSVNNEVPNNGAADDDRQSVTEGADLQPEAPQDSRPMQLASERSAVSGGEAGTVNAVQVSMDRSGAEHIEAQRVTNAAGGIVLGLVATGVQIGGVGGYAYAYGYGYTAENGASPNGSGRRFPFGRRLRSGSTKS